MTAHKKLEKYLSVVVVQNYKSRRDVDPKLENSNLAGATNNEMNEEFIMKIHTFFGSTCGKK